VSTGIETSSPSVLLGFTARNVRSFRDEVSFSLEAKTTANPNVVRDVRWRDGDQTLRVLPAAGVFGANASGKSTLLKAVHDLRRLVLGSFRQADPVGGVERTPFLLDEASRTTPSYFEIDFIVDGTRHRYGCEVDDERVLKEWAVRLPHGREQMLFHRDESGVHLGPATRVDGKPVLGLLRDNALFLSTAAATNHPVLLPLFAWFRRNLILAEAESRPFRQALTIDALSDDRLAGASRALLQAADLGVSGAHREPLDPETKDRIRRAIAVLFEGSEHQVLEDQEWVGESVRLIHRGAEGDRQFHLADESLGTLVWFGLVGTVVHALRDGTCLLADELDASLHPDLVRRLLELFQDPESNPNRAQLIFNSHDNTLLDGLGDFALGRDQVWFTEKTVDGSTSLQPLTDFAPRKSEPIGERYRSGRFGGTPLVTHGEFVGAVKSVVTAEH
jgi:uncharacterized protein